MFIARIGVAALVLTVLGQPTPAPPLGQPTPAPPLGQPTPAPPLGQQTPASPPAQAPAPPQLRPPTRADILRGEYGRYRANNDLLSYHLDVRVDPEKKSHQRQEHHPLQDAQGRHAASSSISTPT